MQSRQRRHFGPFLSNFDKCRPEVADGVVSDVAVEYVGPDLRIKVGNSRSNSYLDIRFVHFVTGNDDERRRQTDHVPKRRSQTVDIMLEIVRDILHND